MQIAAPPGCEPAARRFYGDLVGLEEEQKPALLRARGGVWFRGGLHVGVERDFVPARKAHPGFRVEQLDALAARLEAAGVPVEWDESIPDLRRFHARDPFGNRVEFLAG